MKITKYVECFIRETLNKKVAPVIEEAEYEALLNECKAYSEFVTSLANDIMTDKFKELIASHPELEGAELYNPLERSNIKIITCNSEIARSMDKLRAQRNEYIEELATRVYIDAVRCKTTEDLINLIDDVIR